MPSCRTRYLLGALLTGAAASACADGLHQVSQSPAGAYEAALVAYEGGFAAAWYDTRDGNAEIYMRLLDARGLPAGPERRLTTGVEESYEPSLDRAGDTLAIAWYDKAAGGDLTAKLGVWNRDGSARWVRTLGARTRNPVTRSDGREIFSAWIQREPDGSEAVWSGFWTVDGQPIAAPRRLAAASRTTWNLNAALYGPSKALVAFDAVAGTRSSELFLAFADASGASTVQRLTADDGKESKYPDIVVGDRRIALTWYDARDGNTEVYLFTSDFFGLMPAAGAPRAIDAGARRLTGTPGESIGAYAAWRGDRLAVAWSDDSGGQHEVYLQLFDEQGVPRGTPQRLTYTDMASLVPAIQPWERGFALAWNEYTPARDLAGRSNVVVYLAEGQ